MNQGRLARWWKFWIFGQQFMEPIIEKKEKFEEVLDSIAFLRAQALSHIESLRAQVNGEDMWFTCVENKESNIKMKDKHK